MLTRHQSEALSSSGQPQRKSLMSGLRRKHAAPESVLGRTGSDPNLLTPAPSGGDQSQGSVPPKRRSFLGLLRRGSSADAASAAATAMTDPASKLEQQQQPPDNQSDLVLPRPPPDLKTSDGSQPVTESFNIPMDQSTNAASMLPAQTGELDSQSAPASPRGRTAPALVLQGSSGVPDLALGRAASDPNMLSRRPSGMRSIRTTPRRMSLLGRLSRVRRSNSIAPDPPVTQEPGTEEQPLEEVPFAEQPSAEVVSRQQPLDEVPFAEQPFAEQPFAGQRLPSTEETSDEVPVAEQPVAEQSDHQRSSAEQPVAPESSQPARSANELSHAQEAAAEDTAAQEAAAEDAAAQEAASERRLTDQPFAAEPSVLGAAAEGRIEAQLGHDDKGSTRQPIAEQPLVKMPSDKQPSIDQQLSSAAAGQGSGTQLPDSAGPLQVEDVQHTQGDQQAGTTTVSSPEWQSGSSVA